MNKKLDKLSQIIFIASIIYGVVGMICQDAIATYFGIEPLSMFAFVLLSAAALFAISLILWVIADPKGFERTINEVGRS